MFCQIKEKLKKIPSDFLLISKYRWTSKNITVTYWYDQAGLEIVVNHQILIQLLFLPTHLWCGTWKFPLQNFYQIGEILEVQRPVLIWPRCIFFKVSLKAKNYAKKMKEQFFSSTHHNFVNLILMMELPQNVNFYTGVWKLWKKSSNSN